jgi:hypothetical protein
MVSTQNNVIQFTPFHPVPSKYTLMLLFHLRLGLPIDIFSLGSSTKLYEEPKKKGGDSVKSHGASPRVTLHQYLAFNILQVSTAILHVSSANIWTHTLVVNCYLPQVRGKLRRTHLWNMLLTGMRNPEKKCRLVCNTQTKALVWILFIRHRTRNTSESVKSQAITYSLDSDIKLCDTGSDKLLTIHRPAARPTNSMDRLLPVPVNVLTYVYIHV